MPLDNKDTDILPSIFTEEYLTKSELATQKTNASYKVKSYDERTDVSIAVVFPWQKTVRVKVTNRVQDISAAIAPEAVNVNEVDRFIESGEYILTFVKGEEGWRVSDLELVKDITVDQSEEYPIPTKAPEEDYEDTAGSQPRRTRFPASRNRKKRAAPASSLYGGFFESVSICKNKIFWRRWLGLQI